MSNCIAEIPFAADLAQANPEQQFALLQQRLNQRVLGQQQFCQSLLIALLADGHLLVEGVPGLAKTLAIKVLASGIEADFQRIQFTPDLLPSDLIGTEIFDQQHSSFHFQPGPLFHNLLLADEINRAPAKVQSALLEAMAERQITVAQTTYPLPKFFMVMATQNPLEHQGTYALPEAQLDRFLLHVRISYPKPATERQILDLAWREARGQQTEIEQLEPVISQDALAAIRRQVLACYISDDLKDYVVELVQASRDPSPYSQELAAQISLGASPRATIALARCACAHAWIQGRDYVSPQDIQAIAPDVLRHRLVLSFAAQTRGVSVEQYIDTLLKLVPVP